jgi:Mn-dependent DtxR family transcriptional regulator
MSTLENELNVTPESVRQVAEELNSVGKFKYYPLR